MRAHEVNKAMTGYIADALNDLLYEVERDLDGGAFIGWTWGR